LFKTCIKIWENYYPVLLIKMDSSESSLEALRDELIDDFLNDE